MVYRIHRITNQVDEVLHARIPSIQTARFILQDMESELIAQGECLALYPMGFVVNREYRDAAGPYYIKEIYRIEEGYLQ
jgi:hypothetical protein